MTSFYNMSAKSAADYLNSTDMPVRSFAYALAEVYPCDDIKERLYAGFKSDAPSISDESVSKNIRNWLTGRSVPQDREDIFKIAFVLGLSEIQADLLLGVATDYGIHYRNGRDVVYTWFLRKGASYERARDYFLSLPEMPHLDTLPKTDDPNLTHIIQNAFLAAVDEDDLRRVYTENLENFGVLHMRAYRYFDHYLDRLVCPTSSQGTVEEYYSLETVTDMYLRHHMPSGADLAGCSVIQKLIKRGWPNATTLKNIRAHREDVPRKLLLLLYIATENIVDDDYSELDEDYLTPVQRLEDHRITLDAMLTDCGMPVIDPRNPTDWLILYSAAAGDETMSERLSEVIGYLF